MFDDQRSAVLNDLDAAHESYYRAELFGGPSPYFHIQSLMAAREPNFERFTNHSYAVLASWGMHRMGPSGSKMREFAEYRASLEAVWPNAMALKGKTPEVLSTSDWDALKAIFCGIRCMASGTSLVGNSKVMAHLLPQLIPPIDREYTLKFLFRNGQIINGLEGEWNKLAQILKEFFYPLERYCAFQSKASVWRTQTDRFKWDTSNLKILDNLLIGVVKLTRSSTPIAGGHPRPVPQSLP
jgi:hypothetical protein